MSFFTNLCENAVLLQAVVIPSDLYYPAQWHPNLFYVASQEDERKLVTNKCMQSGRTGYTFM